MKWIIFNLARAFSRFYFAPRLSCFASAALGGGFIAGNSAAALASPHSSQEVDRGFELLNQPESAGQNKTPTA